MKTISSHEIVDHGVNNSQYFQGCGVARTEFTDVATGIGDTPSEALDDALESLAQNGWDVSIVADKLSETSDLPEINEDDDEMGYDGVYHYVSVRVR